VRSGSFLFKRNRSVGAVVFFQENKMTQSEINLAVAEALGESVSQIRHAGFTLLEPEYEFVDPECDVQDPQVLDWDQPVGSERVASFFEFAA